MEEEGAAGFPELVCPESWVSKTENREKHKQKIRQKLGSPLLQVYMKSTENTQLVGSDPHPLDRRHIRTLLVAHIHSLHFVASVKIQASTTVTGGSHRPSEPPWPRHDTGTRANGRRQSERSLWHPVRPSRRSSVPEPECVKPDTAGTQRRRRPPQYNTR